MMHALSSFDARVLGCSLVLFSGLVVGCGGDTENQGGSGASTTAPMGGGGSGGVATGGSGGQGGTATTSGTNSGAGLPTSNFNCDPADGPVPPLKLTQIAKGFTRPLQVRAAPGDSERLFVVEQVGKVWILKNGEKSAEPFLDIQALVANPDTPGDYHQEQGLLGIAFHPNYEQNGRFFVNYSEGPWTSANPKGDSFVAEYKRSSNPDKAEPVAVKQILKQAQPYKNHNGGNLEFSPKDGFLYIGFGDGGAAGDPGDNAQNLSTWLGKMLRINVDSGDPYSIPAGNVQGGKLEIWSKGLRNPWRYSFDGCTGDLYIADVGQDLWEEVDIEPVGVGGRNYGWKVMEATHCYAPSSGCDQSEITLPVVEYNHTEGTSISGGFVYRGSKIPGLRGYYFYSDFTTDNTWIFKWSGEGAVTPTKIKADLSPYQGIVSYGQDNEGEIYLVSLYGTVYRLDPE